MNKKDRHSWKKEKFKQAGTLITPSQHSYVRFPGGHIRNYFSIGDRVPLAPNKNRLSQKARRKRAKWV